MATRTASLVDTPAPQIEHPLRPHTSATDTHAPVGFGAIPPHWSPRRDYAGTFDEVWQQERMPLPPRDYDPRAASVAHPTLCFQPHLVPGDPLGIAGMSLEALAFTLPALPVSVIARSDVGGRRVVRPLIDTVLVDTNARRLEVTVRASFPVGRGRDVLRELVVDNGEA
ncbi:MAG: DUF2169 domain-containing protein [Polyangiaceae bacterium]